MDEHVRRRLLGKCVVLLLLASAVYFPVFWNKGDSIAQPARAVRSQVKPSARDASSDLYRVQENENLKLNIKQGGLIGKGFGLKIDYALPITDISPIDPLIAYIPHNDVLYVEMRMGVLGGIPATTRDLARMGLLGLNNGRWGDKQILSDAWIKLSNNSPTHNLP